VFVLEACTADLPQQEVGDASFIRPCSLFADKLFSLGHGGMSTEDNVGNNAENVLGAPDQKTISLTTDDVLTVGFLGLGSIVDQDGNDMLVHGSMDSIAEVAVYAQDAQGTFVFIGNITHFIDNITPASMHIDLSVGRLRNATVFEFVGLSGNTQFDALEAIASRCPTPSE